MPSFETRRPLPLLALALWLLPLSAVGATAIDDYAFAAPLEASDAELQRVELTAEILTRLTRPDLADVAVFNADGKRLPRRIGRNPTRIDERQVDLEVHAFQRFVERNPRQVTRRESRLDEDGSSELTTSETVMLKTLGNRYLVDLEADGVSRRFRRLSLEWRQQPEDQLLELRLEVGDELGKMRPVATPAVISNSAGGDTGWRSISGIDGHYRYLSLTPVSDVEHFELTRVIGHYQVNVVSPALSYAGQLERLVEQGKQLHRLALPWVIRPAALRLIPAEPNGMLVAEIYTSSGDQAPKLLRQRVRQHSFDSARIAPSPPVTLPPGDYDQLWFSFVDAPENSPAVEVFFDPWELHFIGDGRKPYRLAWGNYAAQSRGDELTPLMGAEASARLRDAATIALGAVTPAGGLSRLKAEVPLPWKKWLLWALLVAAALVTASMAIRLYREMNAADRGDTDR